ncbi:MAG: leucine--tRNA ligase, partial [Clostridiales bacterium]|nr:leucine--tRNA ligase [Clostridiales bacterium]
YTEKLRYSMHETIKKVSEDFEAMKFNTAIAQMMTLVNEIYAIGSINKAELKTLIALLNPVAPHITEEMWRNLGETTDLAYQPWPQWDEKALVKSEVEIAVQVCGKIRSRIMIPADMTKEVAETELAKHPEVEKILAGKTVVKTIFVPGRLVNFIAK